MWLSLAFLSAVLLGFYDLFKKQSLVNNAVVPVLFLNTVFCSLLFVPVLLINYCDAELAQRWHIFLPQAPMQVHLFILIKSCIVLTSWLFAYFAMKHLPITIASPIRASQPIFTLLGAVLLFGERLNTYQWLGVATALTAFYLLSLSGKREGIRFTHNKWIWCIVLATLTGAMSGLYDKYLMSQFDRMVVQTWYTLYQVPVMLLVLLLLWYPKRKESTPFEWRIAIPLISLFLVLADFVYFYALSQEDAMISIISTIRRSGAVVSFIGGVIFFKEKNIRAKLIPLLFIILGMILLYLGTR